MSTDELFETLSYPRLAGEAGHESDRASVRGYAAGYAAGARAAASDAALAVAETSARAEALESQTRSRVQSALQALDSAAGLAVSVFRPVIADADAALAAAALDLAEAILGRELEDHETSARAAITRALSVAANDEVLVIRMNPADLDVLGEIPASLTAAKLVGDVRVQRGDAVLETPVGTIDARLTSAVERARAILCGGAS